MNVVTCNTCPRLREYCENIAKVKRKAYRDQEYWGKPIAGFGSPDARLIVVGLAPGAHGANRTGRVFTGDRSGEWLYRSLHRFGFANQPEATGISDGLKLQDAYITCVVKCAPPDNRPTPDEYRNCAPYFAEELKHRSNAQVYLAMGRVAFETLWKSLGCKGSRPKPGFQHGLEIQLDSNRYLLLSFHPSQQNTFTGKLTEPMFDAVFERARTILGNPKK